MMQSTRTLDLIYMCSKRQWTASLHPANGSCWNMKKAARTVQLVPLWIGPSKNLLELVFYFLTRGCARRNKRSCTRERAILLSVELRSDAKGTCTQACTQLNFDVHPHIHPRYSPMGVTTNCFCLRRAPVAARSRNFAEAQNFRSR
jgi:hypothetical protein